MAAIYLRHPVHGEKVACSEFEAQDDRANGWVDFVPEASEPAQPEQPVEAPVPASVAGEPVVETVVEPETIVVPDFLAPVADPVEEPVVESDLPEDFPGRAALIAAGYTTWESLVDKTYDDLIAINGIGDVTANKILALING